MNKQLQSQFTRLTANAAKYTGKPPRVKSRSSLHEIIKTKQQAARFFKLLALEAK